MKQFFLPKGGSMLRLYYVIHYFDIFVFLRMLSLVIGESDNEPSCDNSGAVQLGRDIHGTVNLIFIKAYIHFGQADDFQLADRPHTCSRRLKSTTAFSEE